MTFFITLFEAKLKHNDRHFASICSSKSSISLWIDFTDFRMQAEFEHVIHQKYLHDKANMPVQLNMNAERSVKQVSTHLPQQTCVIVWLGLEKSQNRNL